MVSKILSSAMELAKSQFGVYVLGHILENGSAHQQQRLMETIIGGCVDLANDVYGGAVLGKAFTAASEQDQEALLDRLRVEPQLLARMAQCRYGYRGVSDLLQALPESRRRDLWDKLVAEDPALRSSKYGQIVAQSIDVSD